MISWPIAELRRVGHELKTIEHQLRRATYRFLTREQKDAIMQLVLDNLAAAVTTLETATAGVQTEIGVLTDANDQPAVDALTGRIQAVNTTLQGLIPAPPAEPETPAT